MKINEMKNKRGKIMYLKYIFQTKESKSYLKKVSRTTDKIERK